MQFYGKSTNVATVWDRHIPILTAASQNTGHSALQLSTVPGSSNMNYLYSTMALPGPICLGTSGSGHVQVTKAREWGGVKLPTCWARSRERYKKSPYCKLQNRNIK